MHSTDILHGRINLLSGDSRAVDLRRSGKLVMPYLAGLVENSGNVHYVVCNAVEHDVAWSNDASHICGHTIPT